MTDRPKPVDLEDLHHSATPPDQYVTVIGELIADLTATRAELAKYKEHSKGDWHEHCRAYLDEFGIGNIGGILDKTMADHTRKLRAERDRLMEAVRESVAIEGKVSLYDAMNGIPEPQALKISQLYYKNRALLVELEADHAT